ncbi:4945_t:CDS:2 [Ambispora gerdemannii]|uniref:4945_t:CDS:1 n=1 Tax=Ambispora gerdemannii TaxID=144530 RepID=A0A9N9BCC6_9GLOM|nr:4945_t:CDS:2 [Ambispora gerdemannii]
MTKSFVKIAPKIPITFQPIVYSNIPFETNNNQHHISNNYTNGQKQSKPQYKSKENNNHQNHLKNLGCINSQDRFPYDYLHPEQISTKVGFNDAIETIEKNALCSSKQNNITAIDKKSNTNQILKTKRKFLWRETNPESQIHKHKQAKFNINKNLPNKIPPQLSNNKIEPCQPKKSSTKVYLDEDSLSEIADRAFKQSKKNSDQQSIDSTSSYIQHPFNTFSHYPFVPNYPNSLQFTNSQTYLNNNLGLPTTETKFDFHLYNNYNSSSSIDSNININFRRDFPKPSSLIGYSYDNNVHQSDYYLKYPQNHNYM